VNDKEFDLLVIGSGPGGYVAAIRAAQLGMNVGLVEKDKLGGVCLNYGCIPTKALLKSAEVAQTLHKAADFGLSAENVAHDFEKIIERSRTVAGQVSKGIEFLMKKNKIVVINGRAECVAPGEAAVFDGDGNRTGTCKSPHIILCTGGRAREIPGTPFDGELVISSKEAMTLGMRPRSMVIIGAGAIGMEFAYFYRSLGTEVTIVEMLPNLLPIEDEEVCKVLERSFRKMKVKFFTGARVTGINRSGDEALVELVDKKGSEKTLDAEKVLVAIGVRGNVENLGLDSLGVEHEKSFIKVDKSYRTSVEGLYAIGDVIGPPLLAHVASHEGLVCVERIAGEEVADIDYDSIPGCTYCQPQVASIGLSEAQAKERFGEVKVGRFQFRGLGKAVASGNIDGLVKLVFDAKDEKLAGAHIVGHDATELLGELILAKAAGCTRSLISHTMHAHPTFSEAVMEAALDAGGEAIHV